MTTLKEKLTEPLKQFNESSRVNIGLIGNHSNEWTIITSSGELKELIKEKEEPKLKFGEEILVRDEDLGKWEKRIFLYEKDGEYVCVAGGEENAFETNGGFRPVFWDQAKPTPLPKKKTVAFKVTEEEEKAINKIMNGAAR